MANVERRYDKPRLEKLGVRPGARVAVVGVPDPDFASELAAWTDDVAVGPPHHQSQLIFLAADHPADLAHLSELRERLTPEGAIWVISRKGAAATLRDFEVMAAARDAGLVDNKVVAFSASHTALRLVIPRAQRPYRP
jgi:hypothetical protein